MRVSKVCCFLRDGRGLMTYTDCLRSFAWLSDAVESCFVVKQKAKSYAWLVSCNDRQRVNTYKSSKADIKLSLVLLFSSAQSASAVVDADSRVVEPVGNDFCVGITRDEADGASILEGIRLIGVLAGREHGSVGQIFIHLDAVVVDDCVLSVG